MEQASIAGILVAGTGPAGLISALALTKAGFSVTLIGPPARTDDRRTTALMAPSLRFLEELGVLGQLRGKAAPLRAMRIADATNRILRSPTVTFRASEIDEEEFGLNVPNGHLTEVLASAVVAEPLVSWKTGLVEEWQPQEDRIVARLEGGKTVSGLLAVAADGRMSPARAAAGIEIRSRGSGQSALVLSFAHSRDHGFVSTEFHTETGPFTQVPLPGKRSSLVWVVRPEQAADLSMKDDAELSRLVEERMQSMLGRVEVEPGRQVYPLSSALPQRFAQSRIALVGEAAHVFPPIGAQGLNLGIRDVQELVGIAADNRDDPGAPEALADYDRRRRPDILARAGAVDMLNRSLLSNLLPAQFARSAGLALLGRVAPLRAFFMREGLKTGSGFGNLFSALGK
ncbi:UbiH/UbiF family hydroxylase [Aquamicrobium sp. LC103]|uniref:UbiH/UbiF family hydroxylase n=1 Tax=Aquamicrobium sp. LC103 TaxID=1120658 RepID=UPI00063EC4D4|nr:UbiH/UbiF family hydroxylase [Aquamicrobium sp. LC103]TKT79325.1 UbiH/UbiF family hydroxylase [Aquamicrobium sp. LC103]